MEYEVTVELLDGQVQITINDEPSEDATDVFLLSWCILKLLKAFVMSHPESVGQMKRIIDITMQTHEELLN